jgi:exonuclease III
LTLFLLLLNTFPMATRSSIDGEAPASLLTTLSLNVNHRADLGGLPVIIRDTRPHLIFLQEVPSHITLSFHGYRSWISSQPQPSRTIAILSRLPGTAVADLHPGSAQSVTIGALSFIHLHAPSGFIAEAERSLFFTSLRPHLSTAVPPVLVGDFNCVLAPLDVDRPLHRHRISATLQSLINDFSYTDSFRTLHPTASVYSYRRRGHPAARLDFALVPPLLESRPRVAKYFATTSDHYAYLLRLETAGLAIPTLAPPASGSLYWKLNSSVLSDPSFLPAFQEMWEAVAATLPAPPPLPPTPPPSPPPAAPVHPGATPVVPTPLTHPISPSATGASSTFSLSLLPGPSAVTGIHTTQSPVASPLARPNPSSTSRANSPPPGPSRLNPLAPPFHPGPSISSRPGTATPLPAAPPTPVPVTISSRPGTPTSLPAAANAPSLATSPRPGAPVSLPATANTPILVTSSRPGTPVSPPTTANTPTLVTSPRPGTPVSLPATANTPTPLHVTAPSNAIEGEDDFRSLPSFSLNVTFPPFTPVFHPPSFPSRSDRPARLARPLNPLAQPFLPAAVPPPSPPGGANPAAAPRVAVQAVGVPDAPGPGPPGLLPGTIANWWEDVAKPAIVRFCRRFSASLAVRRTELRRFAVQGLELALSTSNWVQVDACRQQLQSLDAQNAAGAAIRAKIALADGEMPGVVHAAAEGRFGSSSGLGSVRSADGSVLSSEAAVEQEVLTYFTALFRGRHVAAGNSEPVDSGTSFEPNANLFPSFLTGLPTLSAEQQADLESPFSLGELEAAVEAAASQKAPGLDGLSYEMYKTTLHLVGEPLLSAFNDMLAAGLLPASMRHGVVKLIPKVAGVPTTAQLRPITLLCTDYKLLTKMFVARLLPLMPSVLKATQLCSVKGRSIFDGPASILSAAEYLHRHGQPGFLLSLDFFHAYDRVSLPWLDKVLEAMGFGLLFRGWVRTLHRRASASFILQKLTPPLEILFSIRQGDPFAGILFTIYVEPFLVRLEAALVGLFVANIKEVSFAYMDDIEILGSALPDLILADSLCQDFEAVSGAILNRNRKTVVLGLGSWAGKQDWPLPWLQPVESAKVLGFTICPTFTASVEATWNRILTGIESTLRCWAARHLPTLLQRVQILEVYIFSKAWYFAQVLPLPASTADRLRRAASEFLWKGRLQRLSTDELHSKPEAGGLSLSCVQTRAQSLLAKQTCHHLEAGGRPAQHLFYWIGISLRRLLPASASPGLTLEAGPPQQYGDLLNLLTEVFSLNCVDTSCLRDTRSALVYKELMTDPPPPRVETSLPHLPWERIWPRLADPLLPALPVDHHFSLLHNILPIPTRLFRLKMAPAPTCLFCTAPVADVLHVFTACRRVTAAWNYLLCRATLLLGLRLSDEDLLYLAWPASPASGLVRSSVALAVLTFSSWVWETRHQPDVLIPDDLRRRAASATSSSLLKTIF